MKWILLNDKSYNGMYNMSFDSYFLENPERLPILRFYSWKPSAISIGYNQKIEYYNSELLETYGVDIVRRATGGRAVYHNNEITYSVIIPNSCSLFFMNFHQLYAAIARAILRGLQNLGINADIKRNKYTVKRKNNKRIECFDSIARSEIVLNKKKIVGSAQRRSKCAVLQHGSIILSDEQYLLKYFMSSTLSTNDLQQEISENENCPDGFTTSDRQTIANSLVKGFESEFECTWIYDLDMDRFLKDYDTIKKRHSIYSTDCVMTNVPAIS